MENPRWLLVVRAAIDLWHSDRVAQCHGAVTESNHTKGMDLCGLLSAMLYRFR